MDRSVILASQPASLRYKFPILETSADALCGTAGHLLTSFDPVCSLSFILLPAKLSPRANALAPRCLPPAMGDAGVEAWTFAFLLKLASSRNPSVSGLLQLEIECSKSQESIVDGEDETLSKVFFGESAVDLRSYR